MRIAWVSPYLPEPATSGGAIRQQRLAAALAQQAELHLFARGELWERPRSHSRELDFFASCWLGRDYWPNHDAGDETPRRVRRGSPRSLWRALRNAHASTPFDGVVVSHSWAALGADSLGLPWLLDEHNVESRYFHDLSRAAGKIPTRGELGAFQDWERKAWRAATGITCVSSEDAAEIGALRTDERKPMVVPNGADLERLTRVGGAERQGGVLFVGSLSHRPNLLAAQRLIESIMPRVWQTQRDTSLTIIGGPPSSELERLARAAAGPVELRGRVPDVAPYLAGERVFLNPLQHGAGSSLKTAEALAAGIPLVSSELGARGFGLVAGEHYARAEDDDEFARLALLALGGAPETAQRAERGRTHARQFAWSTLGAHFASYAQRLFSAHQHACK